jgi:phenylpropionate dioxygenase-like ring-hydroxylating dioxygenase large terminal subunit
MATTLTPKRWESQYPELGTEPLPVEPYISQRYFELERERIFERVWLNVGRIDDCPNPGDYFVRDVVVCNASVLITHGKDGIIRAFYNVCSHRGNKLVWDERGKTKNYISCCFHGWTYDLEGRLRSVTDEGNFAELDKERLGLTPLPTETWKGFIFVNFDPEPNETLADYLGLAATELADYPLEELSLTWRYDIPERSNWKVSMDAQNELYHLPVLGPVHGSSAALYTTTPEGYTRFSHFKRLGRHTLWSTDRNPDYESQGLERVLFEKAPLSKVQMPTHGEVFDYYAIFPNFVMAILMNTMLAYNFWPLAVDHTVWEVRMYVPRPENAGELLYQHYWKAKIRDVLAEDIASHESTYAGLATRAKKEFHLQDEEIQIRSFHKTLHSYVDPAEVGA